VNVAIRPLAAQDAYYHGGSTRGVLTRMYFSIIWCATQENKRGFFLKKKCCGSVATYFAPAGESDFEDESNRK
jgi:hypothetical protein